MVAHLLALLYVLPAFLLASDPASPSELAGLYRISAVIVLVTFAMYWNWRYWTAFIRGLTTLAPEIRERTDASIRVTRTGVTFVGEVGLWDHLSLRLRYLARVIVCFTLWGPMLVGFVVGVIWLVRGLAGVSAFLQVP